MGGSGIGRDRERVDSACLILSEVGVNVGGCVGVGMRRGNKGCVFLTEHPSRNFMASVSVIKLRPQPPSARRAQTHIIMVINRRAIPTNISISPLYEAC